MNQAPSSPPTPTRRPWYRILYLQVLAGVLLGILVGFVFPEFGKSLKPLGDGFVRLVKMIIAPIIFCTVVHGIASMGDMRRLGRLGLKALVYFEVVSTLALILGLIVVNLWRPGAGFDIDPATLDARVGAGYAEKARAASTVDYFLGMIPRSYFDAFASGDLLQVLLVSILTAFAVAGLGERGRAILRVVEHGERLFFAIMQLIVSVAPLAAFGAMAFTVGSYGMEALGRLFSLMVGFYLTAALFVVGVLGSIARAAGFSVFRFLAYIREEILLVLGTSSSETALPGLMAKLRRLGCSESTVGFVVPTGYSFNLDGTNIYMTMAAVFLAQATNTPLSLGQQISLLLVAMVSSKGASGVTGAGFVTLAATLSAVPSVPLASLALLVGIDRFMSECRAITNLIGNGVATVAIARWEGEVTPDRLRDALGRNRSAADPGGSRDTSCTLG
ncbi:MAG: dicarboxylate/amino acid:cation symporter [Verrucomicrobiales bacterium]|nr:dicarboxylate/amino acid:cation symporter [Verrucomicrobiales bacterium]